MDIHLTSHARAPDPNNTQSITFNAGKPETIVVGDCSGYRMREPYELVHYREDDNNPKCQKCGNRAIVWLGTLDKWEAHKSRCI